MSKLRFRISMSLDGFVAGPCQSTDNPLGIGGMRLHEWVFPLAVWRSMHGLELLLALTVVNFALLVFKLLSQIRPAWADGVTPVLRGRALEIVDDRGRVRAWVNVVPANTQPNGETYAAGALTNSWPNRDRNEHHGA